ncbi:hypothetical protein EVAR_3500_1 [Eumeta japonica]|uniref:Uncharacterized protein n=1 Tax=Eumeta variegata TaxID=151549 RepID=A0A4C1YST8_EUMVA|nr:hypothetical protein EVAR_3500_1 [Eumeta japonica]
MSLQGFANSSSRRRVRCDSRREHQRPAVRPQPGVIKRNITYNTSWLIINGCFWNFVGAWGQIKTDRPWLRIKRSVSTSVEPEVLHQTTDTVTQNQGLIAPADSVVTGVSTIPIRFRIGTTVSNDAAPSIVQYTFHVYRPHPRIRKASRSALQPYLGTECKKGILPRAPWLRAPAAEPGARPR